MYKKKKGGGRIAYRAFSWNTICFVDGIVIIHPLVSIVKHFFVFSQNVHCTPLTKIRKCPFISAHKSEIVLGCPRKIILDSPRLNGVFPFFIHSKKVYIFISQTFTNIAAAYNGKWKGNNPPPLVVLLHSTRTQSNTLPIFSARNRLILRNSIKLDKTLAVDLLCVFGSFYGFILAM